MSGRRLRACVVCGVLAIDKPGAYCARFPSDENRCRDWIRAIGREDLVHVPIEKLNLLRFICGEHFDRRDFNEKGNRLKKYAIPKINLTACPLSENQLIGFPQHIDTEQSTHSGNKQEQIPETSNASGDPRPETTQQLQTTVPINEERNEYFELLRLEQCAIIPNTEDFECSGCMDQCAARAGVVLHECLHAFCRECLSAAVRNCKEPTIPCLTTGCRGKLQEREIRGLLTREEHERWLARGLALAESGAQEAFHCRTADCGGWALCEPGVLHFPCQVCRRVNCVPCKAIHEGQTCEQYSNVIDLLSEPVASSSKHKQVRPAYLQLNDATPTKKARFTVTNITPTGIKVNLLRNAMTPAIIPKYTVINTNSTPRTQEKLTVTNTNLIINEEKQFVTNTNSMVNKEKQYENAMTPAKKVRYTETNTTSTGMKEIHDVIAVKPANIPGYTVTNTNSTENKENQFESENKQQQISKTSIASANRTPEKLQQIAQTVENTPEQKDIYSELIQLEQCAVVPNQEPFECSVCMKECAVRAGVVLHECLHAFCRECVAVAVRHCEKTTVACLTIGCYGMLQEREIRDLLTREEYERWLARGLARWKMESGAREAFHCRTPDCGGWVLCKPGVLHFSCQICQKVNCVPCQVIHEGQTCEQYLNIIDLTSEPVASTSGHTQVIPACQQVNAVAPAIIPKYTVINTNLTVNKEKQFVTNTNSRVNKEKHLVNGKCVFKSNKQEIPEASYASASLKPEEIQQVAQTVENTLEPKDIYSELIELEQCAVVPNAEPFECSVCLEPCAARAGVVLRECVHAFCRECVAAAVRHCEDTTITCLNTGCYGMLQEREIRDLLTREEHERWLARGLALAESGAQEAFHCRTADCGGWALCEPGVLHFPCQVCRRVNCVPCQAIHKGETCEQYRNAATAEYLAGSSDAKTQALIGKLVRRGEAMLCPQCRILITKKVGCDWIQCTACKTEICWVTRGPRWGPAGRGDTSAGCRCRVGGKRCHPKCKYCH